MSSNSSNSSDAVDDGGVVDLAKRRRQATKRPHNSKNMAPITAANNSQNMAPIAAANSQNIFPIASADSKSMALDDALKRSTNHSRAGKKADVATELLSGDEDDAKSTASGDEKTTSKRNVMSTRANNTHTKNKKRRSRGNPGVTNNFNDKREKAADADNHKMPEEQLDRSRMSPLRALQPKGLTQNTKSSNRHSRCSDQLEIAKTALKQSNDYEHRWMKRFRELKECKAEHGNFNVPRRHQKDPELANWVFRQRRLYNGTDSDGGSLSKKRIKLLDDIGFVWKVREDTWEERFERLKNYKAEHGNCNVPKIYPKDPELGHWVNDQRNLKKKKTLSDQEVGWY